MTWQIYWSSWSWPEYRKYLDKDYNIYSYWFFIGPLQFHWYSK